MKNKLGSVINLIILFFVVLTSCEKEEMIESNIINQVIPSLIDSINMKNADLNNRIHFNILDSLLKPLDSIKTNYSVLKENGIIINNLKLEEKEKCKLTFKSEVINDTSLITIASSFKSFNTRSDDDSTQDILLAFSRIYLGAKKNEGFFVLLVYLNPSSSREYIVYCVKKNFTWYIKRVLLSGVA